MSGALEFTLIMLLSSFLSLAITNLVAFSVSFNQFVDLWKLNKYIRKGFPVSTEEAHDGNGGYDLILIVNGLAFRCRKDTIQIVVNSNLYLPMVMYVSARADYIRPTYGDDYYQNKILFGAAWFLLYLFERRPKKVYNTFNAAYRI